MAAGLSEWWLVYSWTRFLCGSQQCRFHVPSHWWRLHLSKWTIQVYVQFFENEKQASCQMSELPYMGSSGQQAPVGTQASSGGRGYHRVPGISSSYWAPPGTMQHPGHFSKASSGSCSTCDSFDSSRQASKNLPSRRLFCLWKPGKIILKPAQEHPVGCWPNANWKRLLLPSPAPPGSLDSRQDVLQGMKIWEPVEFSII